MTKVLIVEDSAVARQVLTRILSSDPEIDVIGTANNGEEALRFLEDRMPDVVTMDIIMPRMDGYEATRRIMQSNPLPVIIVSASVSREEVEKTWKAVDAGAVAILEKPGFNEIGTKGGHAEKLIETVKVMSRVKVVGRRGKSRHMEKDPMAEPSRLHKIEQRHGPIQLVAIGASTGGPPALREILVRLSPDFDAPVLIVQHISPGFTQGFVDWLNSSCQMNVQLARHGLRAVAGNVYVAPDRCQMLIDRRGVIHIQPDNRKNGIAPSVAALFRSTVEAFGDRSIGVLLTGMGRDGAQELKLMKDRGAPTIAQDKESCVIYGMPAEAMKLNAVKYSLPIERIGEMLCVLVNHKGD